MKTPLLPHRILIGALLAAGFALVWPGPQAVAAKDSNLEAIDPPDLQRIQTLSQERPQRIPDVRPLRQRGIQRPTRTRTTTISEREDRQLQHRKNELFRQVVAYLDDNPEEINRFLSRSSYAEFRRAVARGRVENWIASQPQREIRVGRETFLLQPNHVDLIDLGNTLQMARDTAHIQRLYERIHNLLPRRARDGVPAPQLLLRMRHEEARSYLDRIIGIYKRFPVLFDLELPDPGEFWNTDCSKEIGAPDSGLTDGASRCEAEDFNSDSLFWNTYFPLRHQHTCIKNQGRRGTCAAFAINSLVESKLLGQTGDAYNLSQQKTYLFGLKRRTSPDRYIDGLPTTTVMQEFASHKTNIQFESVWSYNRSPFRHSLNDEDTPFTYPNSCWGYDGPMCTNFAFQGIEELECSGQAPQQTCERVYEYPAGNTDVGAIIDNVTTIKLPGMSVSDALDIAIGLLSGVNAEPVLVRFAVYNSYESAASDGRVGWAEPSEGEEPNGHASVLIGFVPNDQLPEGVSKAEERGYFILKNSWGINRGDCGYDYVDYEYLRHALRNLHAIDV